VTAGGGLSDDEVAAVLARAAELEGDRRPALAPRLDEAAVEQIAVEAGLDRTAVRQALAELRAGTLEPAGPRRGGRLLGPGSVRLQRVVPGPRYAVERNVRSYLHRQLFTVARHSTERTQWIRREGLVADLRRGLDFTGRLRLKKVGWLGVTIVDEPGTDGEKVLVAIEADAGGARAAHGFLLGAGGVVGAGAVAAAAVVVDPVVAVAAPAGLLAGGGAGHIAGRSLHRRRSASVATVLAGLLDRLEHPDTFRG